jgi:hypothetical protein
MAISYAVLVSVAPPGSLAETMRPRESTHAEIPRDVVSIIHDLTVSLCAGIQILRSVSKTALSTTVIKDSAAMRSVTCSTRRDTGL